MVPVTHLHLYIRGRASLGLPLSLLFLLVPVVDPMVSPVHCVAGVHGLTTHEVGPCL